MEDNWAAFVIVGIFVSMCLSISIVNYQNSMVDIEATKNGLQQCLIDRKILWKKDCP